MDLGMHVEGRQRPEHAQRSASLRDLESEAAERGAYFEGSQRPGRADGVAASTIELEDLSAGDLLLCARCDHPVTTTAARVDIGGEHVHRRENPHGYFFTFGCFGAAPGAVAATEPTQTDSWFDGFAWSIAQCSECAVHLGWHFTADRQQFFGLILERLREAD